MSIFDPDALRVSGRQGILKSRSNKGEIFMANVVVNQVNLAGNLTRDPELRFTPNGTPVAKVAIAVNNRIKKGQDWVDDPCYIDITVFGKRA